MYEKKIFKGNLNADLQFEKYKIQIRIQIYTLISVSVLNIRFLGQVCQMDEFKTSSATFTLISVYEV